MKIIRYDGSCSLVGTETKYYRLTKAIQQDTKRWYIEIAERPNNLKLMKKRQHYLEELTKELNNRNSRRSVLLQQIEHDEKKASEYKDKISEYLMCMLTLQQTIHEELERMARYKWDMEMVNVLHDISKHKFITQPFVHRLFLGEFHVPESLIYASIGNSTESIQVEWLSQMNNFYDEMTDTRNETWNRANANVEDMEKTITEYQVNIEELEKKVAARERLIRDNRTVNLPEIEFMLERTESKIGCYEVAVLVTNYWQEKLMSTLKYDATTTEDGFLYTMSCETCLHSNCPKTRYILGNMNTTVSFEEKIHRHVEMGYKKEIDADGCCVLCTEALSEVVNDGIVRCNNCRAGIHSKCFTLWEKRLRSKCYICFQEGWYRRAKDKSQFYYNELKEVRLLEQEKTEAKHNETQSTNKTYINCCCFLYSVSLYVLFYRALQV